MAKKKSPKKPSLPRKSPKKWIKDKAKRRTLVNDAIRRRIKKLHLQKEPRKESRHKRYSKDEVSKFVRLKLKGKLVSQKEYDKISADPDKSLKGIYTFEEAKILKEERDTNWYERFTVVKERKVLRKYEKIDEETGERKIYKRWRTERQFRDKETGRMVSYSERSKFLYEWFGYVPSRNNPEYDKALTEFSKSKSSRKIDVYNERMRMRKELSILQIAQRKNLSLGDARELYESLADDSYERYILKEYAGTPD